MFPPENTPTPTFPYRIEEQIGSGSMGVVYRARELALNRTVAIKTMRQAILEEEPPEVRQEMCKRFLQEAQAAAALSHPGATTVFRVGEEEGFPYLVMEWLEGRTLEDILHERGSLEIAEAARVAVAVLDALEAAHRSGVVHRDIKPSNLMVLHDGRLKITDFGIALLKGRELVKTQAGVVLATPRFASPEQLRGGDVDGRADLFATGILLYHMLTGDFPFAGEGFMGLANAILQEDPRPIQQLRPDVPPALGAVIQTALRKDRARRFPSAAEMADELRPFTSAVTDSDSRGSGRVLDTAIGETVAERLRAIHRDLPSDPKLALVRLAESWPQRTLPGQSTHTLLDRLLEKPLHAPAFAGAVVIDGICLLIEDGMLLGAIDAETGESGDAVAERLPAESGACLHALPPGSPEGLVALLATVLHPPRRRHRGLDSSFINLPALARKLREEKFDGIFRLSRGAAYGLVYILGGETVLSLYSQGWDEVPIDESWSRWVSRFPVHADVEQRAVAPLGTWYRRALRDLALDVEPIAGEDAGEEGKSSSARIRELFQSSRTATLPMARLGLRLASRGAALANIDYELAPAYRFLTWMLQELPPYFAERDKIDAWKYLIEWVFEVRKASLYHELPRPDSREADYFDLVTANADGKVLHLAQRVERSSPQVFQDFLERVIGAKTARKKTGDVGGVCLIAPQFDDATLETYRETVKTPPGGLLGLEESLTGYEGFVRIGPRRGFHLLLVEESGAGFAPLVPS